MAQTGTHARPRGRRAGRLPLLLLLVTFLAVGGVLVYFAVSAAGSPSAHLFPKHPSTWELQPIQGRVGRLRQRICRRTRSRFPISMCEPTS